jgi:hypothetical protein
MSADCLSLDLTQMTQEHHTDDTGASHKTLLLT